MAKKRKRRKKKVARRKRAARARPGAAVRAGGLVAQMRAYRAGLMNQQAALQAEIDGLTAALEALGGAARPRARAAGPAGRRPRRGRPTALRAGSLKSFILKVLKPRGEMAVKDIAVAVRRVGYKTKSSNVPNQVSNALAQMTGLTKTGRGRYRL